MSDWLDYIVSYKDCESSLAIVVERIGILQFQEANFKSVIKTYLFAYITASRREMVQSTQPDKLAWKHRSSSEFYLYV